jgi:hypothetical protein
LLADKKVGLQVSEVGEGGEEWESEEEKEKR